MIQRSAARICSLVIEVSLVLGGWCLEVFTPFLFPLTVQTMSRLMKTESIRIGALGAGGFGLFALQQFTQIPGVELAGMAATHREAAFAMTQRFGVPDIQDEDALLARDDINLVYIATPPFLHHAQAIKALRAGKHVIC